ncbi:hypothetical protein [Thalassotalea piscium]|uniref:ABC-type protease/lipase transport system fused ATPase/permease subunit n=1 Tax=Thalassotalea piscium TaxID=1230533 RepID=A0A7X0NGN9_9GAMM|nr:hypothetical protein [Thalassotalea piscium]MBB6543114.1 ABC-type protease/lipase transport system fused ATPase/permease subunit [Thalassotalea piscium]
MYSIALFDIGLFILFYVLSTYLGSLGKLLTNLKLNSLPWFVLFFVVPVHNFSKFLAIIIIINVVIWLVIQAVNRLMEEEQQKGGLSGKST